MEHHVLSTKIVLNLCVLLLLGALFFSAGCEQAEENKLSLSELRTQRKEVARRKRRIIFNNDGDDIAGYGGLSPDDSGQVDTPEELLNLRTTPLLGSQVDSIFYHSTFGMKCFFEAGAFKTIYDYPDPDTKGFYSRNGKALIANYGKDALEVMVDFTHKHGLEIFYSNRTNDAHDYYFPEWLAYIKVKHPEYTIGHAQAEGDRSPQETLKLMRKRKGSYTGLNFELEIIRDLTVEAMRQVCRNYDIDGLELDFFRSPTLFPSVGPEQVELLNDMMRKMRKMTEEEGMRRGRPILIAARCINNPKRSLKKGLDVKTWLKEDLIDILMPIHVSGKMGSLKEFIDLSHRYNVPVYPCPRENWNQSNRPIARGAAIFRFAEGADGITTFNRFDPTDRLWSELGDPEVLRTLDRTYICPTQGVMPATVTDAGCELPLFLAEDLTSAPSAGKGRSCTLRVRVANLTAEHGLSVELNGKTLQAANMSPSLTNDPQDVWLEFVPDPAMFKIGKNLVTASVNLSNSLKDRIAALKASTTVIPFSQQWRFATDPADTGISDKWHKVDFDDSTWTVVRSNIGQGWEYEIGPYDGYGWYRAELPALPEGSEGKRVYIYFGAVDEQAWIYLNGQLVAENTVESTGLSQDTLWATPFIIDVTKAVQPEAPNTLAVRVHDSLAQGGIWRPVSLIISDVTDMNARLAVPYLNDTLGRVQITDVHLDLRYPD